MSDADKGLVLSADTLPKESFDDPARGSAYWHTLFSGDTTPTSGMSAGVMVLPPGARLEPHRHAQAELYFVAAGAGMVTISGTGKRISTGDAAYIPGDAMHSLCNDGAADLRVFYVFPADRFSDVVYHFE